jgi:hypothetical protein
MCAGKARAYPSEASFRSFTIEYAPGLINISLSWKGLLVTNTLAYYEHLQIKEQILFLTLGSVFRGHIFSHVRPFCERAVSNLDP